MQTLTVSLGERSYPIYIGEGVLLRAGELIEDMIPQPRAIVITDANVGALYAEALQNSLSTSGIQSDVITLLAGEGTKSFGHLEKLMESILELKPERNTTLIALGGGVIGDITGFAASILLRGVPFVQIPTSLLAQVDSSVGGKTAINSAHGKNLIGSFYQPKAVLIDVSALNTLPKRELHAGYAEVLKYGLIDDAEFFNWLNEHGAALIDGDVSLRSQAILKSCQAKAAIVAEDEKEKGKRALLNLGHTFGHALEKATGYSEMLLHGEAVALGCVMAAYLSEQKGISPSGSADAIASHLGALGIASKLTDIQSQWNAAELTASCHLDKKVSGNKMTFILMRGIGDAFVTQDITDEEVTNTFLWQVRNDRTMDD